MNSKTYTCRAGLAAVKHISRSVLILLQIIVPSFVCAKYAVAETTELPNYISIKHGSVQSNAIGGLFNAQFASDNGVTEEIGFLWGSKDYLRILGNVQVDSNNKIINYSLGYLLNSTDMIVIRNSNINDELYKTDFGANGVSVTGTFGQIHATKTEYSYVWKSATRSDDAYYSVTYGESNFPTDVSVSGSINNTFTDPSPKFKYLFWGIDADPIRNALMENKLVSDGLLANSLFYGNARTGFGILDVTLSSIQYNALYDTPATKYYGLQNQSNTSLYMPFYVETGMYFQSSGTSFKGIGTLGVYWQTANPLGAILLPGSTTTGDSWYTSGLSVYGIVGRIAMKF